MGSRFVSYCQLTLAMCIVGSVVVVGKLITASFPVMLSSCLRFAIASPVLIALLYWREGPFTLPKRADLTVLILQAFTGVFLFSTCLLYGLQDTGAIEAGIITGTLPAVTAMLAMFFLREKLNSWQMLGIVSTVVGATLLNVLEHSDIDTTATSLVGVALVFAAVICEALFAVFGKITSGRVSALTVATLLNIFAFLLFLPFAIWESVSFDFTQPTLLDWSFIVYFGLVVSIGAFWLFSLGLAKVPASIAGGFMAFLPLSAVLLSCLILHEKLVPLHLVAGACVIGGIALLNFPSSNKKIGASDD